MIFYIAGAGGFGRETLDALRACGAGDAEFLDEHPAGAAVDEVPVHHPGEAGPGTFVVAIADPAARHRIALTLECRGLIPGRVIHPRAVVSPGAAAGPGLIALANAFISTGTRLGAYVHVNYNVTIGHDAVLGNFVTVLPGANIAGGVILESGVTIGSNACVLPRLRIGIGTVVGAGAVVTRDQPPATVVAGVPARALRSSRAEHPPGNTGP